MTSTLATLDIDIEADAQYEVDELFRTREWSDGLPVRLPRVDLVDRFIEQTGIDPDYDFGTVPPLHGRATLHSIAVNAYMAGCQPKHVPLIIGALQAMVQPRFQFHPVQATTNPVAPLAIVNGPQRAELGISSGRNLLAPGSHFNGAVGRAVRLVMRNIGGAVGDVDMGTHGMPAKYTACFAEDEENSPWEPFHASLGYRPTDNVVTTVPFEGMFGIIPAFGNTQAHQILETYGRAVRTPGTNLWFSKGTGVLLLCAGHAQVLAKAGIDRKQLQELMFQAARIPLSQLPAGNIPNGTWTVEKDEVLLYEKPEDIYIVVGGGEEGHHTMYFLPLGICFAASSLVPKADELGASRALVTP